MNEKKLRPIAIYLPQFHPIPENNIWWEEGFTEWTNVAKAKPLFKGHYQPHLPADMGYYDLRVPEAREAQAALAKEHGIYGFCYYHYWFNGRRLLERPFNEVLETGKPDFPFMLFWANETWSRRWLGEERDILIKQTYSTEDDHNHAAYLVNVFKDKRYITIDGSPVFIIYRPFDLPDVAATIRILRNAAEKEGLKLYIVASNSHAPLHAQQQLLNLGFDSVLNFMPQLGALPDFLSNRFLWRRLSRNMLQHSKPSGRLKLFSYKQALKQMQRKEPTDFKNIVPCVFTGWDNTARRNNNAIIIEGNTPALFKAELIRVKEKLSASRNEHDLFFINAWNEWAEGNHLEPDVLHGSAFLKAVKDVFEIK